ncbi:MAG: divergent polysaccharide deacetylase family protein [Exilispira sp.]
MKKIRKAKKCRKKNSNFITYTFVTSSILLIFLSVIILFFSLIKSQKKIEVNNIYTFNNYEQINIQESYRDSYNRINEKTNINILKNPEEKKEERKRKSICIIIDDYGYQDTSSILLNLPFKISVSILPGLPYSKTGFEIFANSKNITPMLHIPMESINQFSLSEKNEIKVSDSKNDIEKKLDLFFSEIPANFANNHMGSKVSLFRETIQIILNYLIKRGVRFIDSHTINNSLFVSTGKALGYPVFENNLFLDYNDDYDLPEKEFFKAINLLKTRDFIIIIGHNTKIQTLNFLQKLASKYYFKNYEFITVRDLFDRY